MSNGKGMAPKAGYNHAAYRENYDSIFSKRSTPYVKPMKPTNKFVAGCPDMRCPASATNSFTTGHAAMHYAPIGLTQLFGVRPTRTTVRPTAKPVKARPIGKPGKGKPARASRGQRRPSPKK